MNLASSTAFQFDHILLSSPSGALIDEVSFDRGCNYLRGCGLPVIEQGAARARFERFAGTDDERIQSIDMALGMRQAGLVVASRGGYGITRLLHRLDWRKLTDKLNAFGHVLCGHSDITALQLGLLAAGGIGRGLLHGPMVCYDFGCEEGLHLETETHLANALIHGCVDITWSASSTFANALTIEGPVWGGNLSMICSLLGTPYLPNISHGLLIIEEVNEPAYKIERMLLQLLQAGVLDRQSAIVLGDMGVTKALPHDNGFTLDSVVDGLRRFCDKPIIQAFPFGHCRPKACYFQGVVGKLSSTDTGFRLVQTL